MQGQFESAAGRGGGRRALRCGPSSLPAPALARLALLYKINPPASDGREVLPGVPSPSPVDQPAAALDPTHDQKKLATFTCHIQSVR